LPEKAIPDSFAQLKDTSDFSIVFLNVDMSLGGLSIKCCPMAIEGKQAASNIEVRNPTITFFTP
jgi:hypothetical protein